MNLKNAVLYYKKRESARNQALMDFEVSPIWRPHKITHLIENWLKNHTTAEATSTEQREYLTSLPELRRLNLTVGELLKYYERTFISVDQRKTLQELQNELIHSTETAAKPVSARHLTDLGTNGNRIIRDLGNVYVDSLGPDWPSQHLNS